ncbi:MAG: protein-tyrosine-phosphatase [Schleiferiaceae bacterium]
MTPLFESLTDYVHDLDPHISAERQQAVEPLINYIQKKVDANEDVNLIFICTHNSRRSHLAQVWAQTLAEYYNLAKTTCYSGGTESTALYPEAGASLSRAGFEVRALSEGNNPVYSIKFAPSKSPVIGFSKSFDHDFNPANNFAAIMVCSHAEENCPFVPGAEARIALPFDDPKDFDNTPQKSAKYDERCREIANELLFAFSSIKK